MEVQKVGITDEKARCSNPECGKEIGWNEQYGHITHPVCFDCWLQGKSLFLEYDNLTPYAQATVCKKRNCPYCQMDNPKEISSCTRCNGTKKQMAFICKLCEGSGLDCKRCNNGIVWKAMERASGNALPLAAA